MLTVLIIWYPIVCTGINLQIKEKHNRKELVSKIINNVYKDT